MTSFVHQEQADTPQPWREPASVLDRGSLDTLMAGEIPAIRIPGFASRAECEQLCHAIRQGAHLGTAAVTSPMNLIGCNFANHGAAGKRDYFAQVAPSYRNVGSITAAAGFDPLARMVSRLRSIWPANVGTAKEAGYGKYFAGGIKTRTAGSRVHYDYAPHTATACAIGQVIDQVGWNLYLDLPAGTGQTTTYNQPIPRDGGPIGHGNALSMALDSRWVEKAESYTFWPVIGEVVLINTRYPHEVIVESLAADEWRVQFSSFIGRLPNNHLILWS